MSSSLKDGDTSSLEEDSTITLPTNCSAIPVHCGDRHNFSHVHAAITPSPPSRILSSKKKRNSSSNSSTEFSTTAQYLDFSTATSSVKSTHSMSDESHRNNKKQKLSSNGPPCSDDDTTETEPDDDDAGVDKEGDVHPYEDAMISSFGSLRRYDNKLNLSIKKTKKKSMKPSGRVGKQLVIKPKWFVRDIMSTDRNQAAKENPDHKKKSIFRTREKDQDDPLWLWKNGEHHRETDLVKVLIDNLELQSLSTGDERCQILTDAKTDVKTINQLQDKSVQTWSNTDMNLVKKVFLHDQHVRLGYHAYNKNSHQDDDNSVGNTRTKRQNRLNLIYPGYCNEDDCQGYNGKAMLFNRRQTRSTEHFLDVDIESLVDKGIAYILRRPSDLSCFKHCKGGFSKQDHTGCRCLSDLKEMLLSVYPQCFQKDETGKLQGQYFPDKIPITMKRQLATIFQLVDAITNANKNVLWKHEDTHRFLLQSTLIPFMQGQMFQPGSYKYCMLIDPRLAVEEPNLKKFNGKIVTCDSFYNEMSGHSGKYNIHRHADFYKYGLCYRENSNKERKDNPNWDKFSTGKSLAKLTPCAESQLHSEQAQVYTYFVWYKKRVPQLTFQAMLSLMARRGHSATNESPPMELVLKEFTSLFWGHVPPTPTTATGPLFDLISDTDDAANARASNISEDTFRRSWKPLDKMMAKRCDDPHSLLVIGDHKLPYIQESSESLKPHYPSRCVLPPPKDEKKKGVKLGPQMMGGDVQDGGYCREVTDATATPDEPKSLELEAAADSTFAKSLPADNNAVGFPLRVYNCLAATHGTMAFQLEDNISLRHASDIGVFDGLTMFDNDSESSDSFVQRIRESIRRKTYSRKSGLLDGDSQNYLISKPTTPGHMIESLLFGIDDVITNQITNQIGLKLIWAFNKVCRKPPPPHQASEDDSNSCHEECHELVSLTASYSFGMPNYKLQAMELPHIARSPKDLVDLESAGCFAMDAIVPCSREGYTIKFWKQGIDLSTNKKHSWEGTIVHVRYGTMLVLPASILRAGGIHVSTDGCPCLHFSAIFGKKDHSDDIDSSFSKTYITPNGAFEASQVDEKFPRYLPLFPPLSKNDEHKRNELLDEFLVYFWTKLAS